jgi:hypothetical protein
MRIRAVILLALMLSLSACTGTRRTVGLRAGPDSPAPVTLEPWSYEGTPAFRLVTPHYTLFTTLPDPAYAKQIAQVMEGGYEQYQQFTPGLTLRPGRMNCYIFADRAQWAEFTRRNTGALGRIYLQINRGGYTLRDWYVAFDLGEWRTQSVAAHEGWHQFAYHNFVGRLPPFLEEGIACMFEDLTIRNGLPRFNVSVNRQRETALRHAVDHHALMPLDELCRLHAGEIVGRSGDTIETFYAQDWAFAKFLWEGEHARYRPAMLHLIADTASGRIFDFDGSGRMLFAGWNPAAVPLLLEHYLGMSMKDLSEHYRAYVQHLAYDEYEEQFAS